jgi:hypothetical protein
MLLTHITLHSELRASIAGQKDQFKSQIDAVTLEVILSRPFPSLLPTSYLFLQSEALQGRVAALEAALSEVERLAAEKGKSLAVDTELVINASKHECAKLASDLAEARATADLVPALRSQVRHA